MNDLKQILRPYYIKLRNFKRRNTRRSNMFLNYRKDYLLYKKHSLTFSQDRIENKEADIILNYHSLEKGMLFDKMKSRFGLGRIQNLHKLLQDKEVIANSNRSQIEVGYQVMCKYYELHQEKKIDIKSFYTQKDYQLYKSILNKNYNSCFNGVIHWTKEDYFKNNDSSFLKFAHSRKSTRNFTGEKFPHDILNKVIELANTAPSVCNRQASRVYLLEDKEKIDKVLQVQGGFAGYTKNVSQLLILTNDRSYYYTIGERNQFYIDGGIYLMNLLYSLHYYNIGNCPANWGKTYTAEEKLDDIIKIPEAEKIICLIPIGRLSESFKTTLSERRPVNESFRLLS